MAKIEVKLKPSQQNVKTGPGSGSVLYSNRRSWSRVLEHFLSLRGLEREKKKKKSYSLSLFDRYIAHIFRNLRRFNQHCLSDRSPSPFFSLVTCLVLWFFISVIKYNGGSRSSDHRCCYGSGCRPIRSTEEDTGRESRLLESPMSYPLRGDSPWSFQ